MRAFSKRVFVVLMTVGLVFFAAGCGKIAEKAAEKAVEVAVKSDGGDVDVDIDSKTGQVTIKGKGADGESIDIKAGEAGMTIKGQGADGSVDIKMDENGMTMRGAGDGQKFQMKVSEGQMTMTTEEGTSTIQATSGSDAQIPADWPKDVPVYAGAKVLGTAVMAQMGMYTLDLETSAGMADVAAYYKKELPAKGWAEQQSFTQGGEATTLMYTKDGQMLHVSVVLEEGTTKIMLMVTKM